MDPQTKAMHDILSKLQSANPKMMNEKVAIAEVDFVVNKNPSGNLSNWVADAVFVNQTRMVRMERMKRKLILASQACQS